MVQPKRHHIYSIYIHILIFLLICPIVFSLTGYEAPPTANFEILAAEINPQPARPGEDMFVKINVENYDKSTAEDVVIEIEKNYPFHFKYIYNIP